MKKVAKYNLYKGISTTLTVGTPIITLCCCSDFFIHRSDTAISAAGVFAILISLLLFKDKIAEHFKMPSAFVLSTVLLVLIIMIENILLPVKYVCISTMCSTFIDEITFKRFYKSITYALSEEHLAYKHFGFIFTTSERLETNGK
jgi:hypothetical protein